MGDSYQEKLEKLVDEQETLIIAEQEALKLLINFCEDRHAAITGSVEKIIEMYPVMEQFSKSFSFFNCDDQMTKEKLEAVPWEHLKLLAEQIPDMEKIKEYMKQYEVFFNTFKDFRKLIDVINEKVDSLTKVSKEVVESKKSYLDSKTFNSSY